MKYKRFLCLLLAGLIMITLIQPVKVSAAYENTYTNSGNYRADLIGVALTQVGYRETYDNKTKYGAWYGLNYQPWCAMFVTWCARQAEIPKSVIANSSFAEPSSDCFNVTREDGSTYTPVPGDLFFKRDYSHTGIVFYVEGKYFYTIEGNTNSNGSDNGTHVMLQKREIANYYFGTYKDSSITAPKTPVVRTENTNYSRGQTIRITWDAMENAKSYGVMIYKDGLQYCSGYTGSQTFYDFKYPEPGEYLINVAVKYADGTTGHGQRIVYVNYAPTLSVQYNVNGGTISEQKKYVVIGGDGTDFYESASTGSYYYGAIPAGSLITATRLKAVGNTVWAEVGFGGLLGWCVISDGHCEQVGYEQNEAGDILQCATGNLATTIWSAGSGELKALLDPQTAGLTKKNHIFAGWSRTQDGSGTIFRQDQTDISAEQIDDSFSYSSKTVKMYAIWQNNVTSICVETLPDKTNYVTDETLDTTGMKLSVTYVDGTKQTISTGFTVSGFDSATVGTKTVTVSYCGVQTTFTVNVEARMKYEIRDGAVVITDYVDNGGVVGIPDTIEDLLVTEIAAEAFAGCSLMTHIDIPASVTKIGEGAFAGCSSLSMVTYAGTQEQWENIHIGKENAALTEATLICGYQLMDALVDRNIAMYLVKHLLKSEDFLLSEDGDINGDSKADDEDAVLLLKYALNPARFPLTAAMENEPQ